MTVVKPHFTEELNGEDICRNIVAAYPLDSGGGSSRLYDVSGNRFHATPSASNSIVNTVFGRSIEKDGSSGTNEIANDTKMSFGDGSSDFEGSISVTFKLNSAQSHALISKDSSPREWLFWVSSGGNILMAVFDPVAGGFRGRRALGAISTDTWYNALWTYDGSGGNSGHKIYLNGVRADDADYTSGSYTNTDSTAQTTNIGARAAGSFELDGIVANIVVWQKRELTARDAVDLNQDPFMMYRKRSEYDQFAGIGAAAPTGNLFMGNSMDGLSGRYYNSSLTGGING